FLSRTTAILATVFFLSSLGLTYLATNRGAAKDLMQQETAPQVPAAVPKAGEAPPKGAAPAAPAPATDANSKAGEIPK
ncbi:MAG: preprotein translocase subunit SecG, partial [Steroidobacterales bacterium]